MVAVCDRLSVPPQLNVTIIRKLVNPIYPVGALNPIKVTVSPLIIVHELLIVHSAHIMQQVIIKFNGRQ
jgi:hypothetical protein